MSGEFPRAGFWRRFASLIYDSLVVISLSMLTAILYFAAAKYKIAVSIDNEMTTKESYISDAKRRQKPARGNSPDIKILSLLMCG